MQAPRVQLTVVSPTYNEAENVASLIATLERCLGGIDYEIIISDDDSPDRTWALVEELGKVSGRIRVLRRTGARSLSAAVIEAFSKARGDVVACIDADLQHDPRILPEMLQALNNDGTDIVVGSRYIEGGGMSHWNWRRRITSWTATKLAASFCGIEVRDPMSGYFMLRRSDFLRVQPTLNCDGFKILLEIIARLSPRRVCEVPYVFRARLAGNSKLSTSVMFAYIAQLWRLAHTRRTPAFATLSPKLGTSTQQSEETSAHAA